MIPELNGLDRVADSMRQALGHFARLVAELAGQDVESLVLFGRVCNATFDPRHHTARSVLVVGRVDLEMLRGLSGQGARFGKGHIAAPLIMTPAYIEASLDSFPLELLEIMQKHITVFGKELFDGLEFEEAHVRLQCERELKVLLMGLRQGLLASAGRDKLLGALERDVAEGLLRVLRGMLWLNGKREPLEQMQSLDEMCKITSTELPGVRNALDPSATLGWVEFNKLYKDVQSLEEISSGN